MTVWEAIFLGILQGLTEFLPVSSSGHLEIGKVLLGIQGADNLTFVVIVHGATVLSTIVVFRKDIDFIIRQLLKFRWNKETAFFFKILLSMIPVGIVGLFFEDDIEMLFEGRLMLVGFMLLITGGLLYLTKYSRKNTRDINFKDAFIIGMAQMIAIMPGISRAGSTISTALILGVDKENATRFSFLMVLLPILGATLLKVKNIFEAPEAYTAEVPALVAGFLAAFIAGLTACSAMISIVKKGKISWFSFYCFLVGTIAIIAGYLS
jgi:undecaprenyl-diphosphatase